MRSMLRNNLDKNKVPRKVNRKIELNDIGVCKI